MRRRENRTAAAAAVVARCVVCYNPRHSTQHGTVIVASATPVSHGKYANFDVVSAGGLVRGRRVPSTSSS